MAFKTLDDADLAGRRALVRVDLNVPMEDGKVTDTTRIDRILPTIREIAAKGAKVVLLAHFGRPKGPDAKNSLKQVVPALAHALGQPVTFVQDCIGDDVAKALAAAKNGDVLLLEASVKVAFISEGRAKPIPKPLRIAMKADQI